MFRRSPFKKAQEGNEKEKNNEQEKQEYDELEFIEIKTKSIICNDKPALVVKFADFT